MPEPAGGQPAAAARLQGAAVPALQGRRAAHDRPPLRRVRGGVGAGEEAARRRGNRARDQPLPRAGPRLLHAHGVRVLSRRRDRPAGRTRVRGPVRRARGFDGPADRAGRRFCGRARPGHGADGGRGGGGHRRAGRGGHRPPGRRSRLRRRGGGALGPHGAFRSGRLRAAQPSREDARGQQDRRPWGRAVQRRGGGAAGRPSARHGHRGAGGGPLGRARGQARVSGYTAPHCGSLRAADAGKDLELYGWVARRRDMGGLIFIDLRDRWGKVQVVFNPASAPDAHRIASDLRSEYVVRVAGRVNRRPSGSENPKLATGEVEVAATELEVISIAKTPPFPVEEEGALADEATRLKYRYLDLRRPRMQAILELRHKVNKIIHGYMDEHEFVEVETPMLIKTTPEGARDFIVPSRIYPGKFYALPQSPQTLKQILMVSGLGRYYQIARCFRDEDLRADRALEFTQLDLEMSFNDEEDVFDLIEGWIGRLWKEILGVDLPRPCPRMDAKEALLRYGTDKPDLRYELEIADLGDVLRGTRAQVFRGVLDSGGVVRGLAVPGGRDMSRRELEELVTVARGAGGRGLAWLPGGPLDKFLSEEEISGMMAATGA